MSCNSFLYNELLLKKSINFDSEFHIKYDIHWIDTKRN
jgi:hypothetical protein